MRLQRNITSRSATQERNMLRRKIRILLQSAAERLLMNKVTKCRRKMNNKDPTAIYQFIEQLSMLNGSASILYYNASGIFLFQQQEISDGFSNDCENR